VWRECIIGITLSALVHCMQNICFARGGLQKHLYWDLRKALNEVVSYDKPEKGFEKELFSRPFMMLQIFKLALFWVTSAADRRGVKYVRRALTTLTT
jgi:hypothetical protein